MARTSPIAIPLVGSLVLVALAGCGVRPPPPEQQSSEQTSQAEAPPPSDPVATPADDPEVEEKTDDTPRAAIETVITTLTEQDGRIIVELPVGSAQGLSAGTLLRVLDPAQQGYLKGMLQVVSILGTDQAMARQIGLHDRRNPLVVGDPVIEIRDLTELDIGGSVEEAARAEVKRLDDQDIEHEAAFADLRANYQKELDAQKARHEEQIADFRSSQDRRYDDLIAAHRRELERRESEHRAELAAVRDALAQEAVETLRQDREGRLDEVRRLSRAKLELEDQLDSMAGQVEGATRRIARLVEEVDRVRASHDREIAAEQETREILESRIRELEVRLGMPGGRTGPVLVNDGGRDETVLAQLERISKERNRLLAEVDALREEIAALEGTTVPDGEDPVLTAAMIREKNLDQERSRLRGDLSKLEDHLSAMELRRLQAERAWFAIAERVLVLPDAAQAVRELQQDVRRSLAEQLPAETEP
jgi:hypothetical protein